MLDGNPIDVAQGGGLASLLTSLQSLSALRKFSINAVTDPSGALGATDYTWQPLGDCIAGLPDGPGEADTTCAFRIHAPDPSNGGLLLQLAVPSADSSPPKVIYTLTDNANGTYDGGVPLSAIPREGYYSFELLRSLPGQPTNGNDTDPSRVVVSKQVDGSPCPFGDCLKQLLFNARECSRHGPFATAAPPDGAVCACRNDYVRVDGEGGGAGWQCERPAPHDTGLNIRSMSGWQKFWMILFSILAVASGCIAVLQTLRLRQLEKAAFPCCRESTRGSINGGGSFVYGSE